MNQNGKNTPTPPGVFVRAARHGGQANKGFAGYGTWKWVRRIGDDSIGYRIEPPPSPYFRNDMILKGLEGGGR